MPSASTMADRVQATLERFFPGFGDLVLQREVQTPLDIERTVGLSEGNIFAGEFLAPQMFFFRPAPGWSQYRTPIAGYYQCGSGHPPGRLRDGSAGPPGGAARSSAIRSRARRRLMRRAAPAVELAHQDALGIAEPAVARAVPDQRLGVLADSRPRRSRRGTCVWSPASWRSVRRQSK